MTTPNGVVRDYVPRTLYPGTLETVYSVLSKPCTLETMHFHQKIDKIKVKPYTFQHENMFIVFTFNTQVET